MSDHDFYAEPTLFDLWQARLCHWLNARLAGLSPYWWVLGFALLGTVFLVTSVVMLAGLLTGGADVGTSLWNQSLAQGLALLVALAATQTLYRQALDVWPGHLPCPACWQRLGSLVGWQAPTRKSAEPAVRPGPQRARKRARASVQQPADREAVQAFFASVRAAGVNVAIARALFRAGIRSTSQLLRADDAQLQAIHGVGQATIRKLRSRFQTEEERHAWPPASSSSR